MKTELYNVKVQTPEGHELELARRLSAARAARLVHRLQPEIGDELARIRVVPENLPQLRLLPAA